MGIDIKPNINYCSNILPLDSLFYLMRCARHEERYDTTSSGEKYNEGYPHTTDWFRQPKADHPKYDAYHFCKKTKFLAEFGPQLWGDSFIPFQLNTHAIRKIIRLVKNRNGEISVLRNQC